MEFKIYGRGGHAKVLQDLIKNKGYLFGGNFDDADPELEYIFNEYDKSSVIIGIGNNKIREKIALKLKHNVGILIHPKAIVAHDVEIGEGTVILAGAVIQSGAKIGKHVIVNANVVIDHDAIIEDYVSIYPGSYIGGDAIIKSFVTIEPNQVVPRNTEIIP